MVIAIWTKMCFRTNSAPSGNNKNVNKRMINNPWYQPQNFTISVSPDSNHPYMCVVGAGNGRQTSKMWEIHMRSVVVICAWAAVRVISDVTGPPSSPPPTPSVTHSQAASAQRSDKSVHTATEGKTARLLLLPARPHWHGPRRRQVISPESCLLSSEAKGNFPLSVFYSDAHVLRWEVAHS